MDILGAVRRARGWTASIAAAALVCTTFGQVAHAQEPPPALATASLLSEPHGVTSDVDHLIDVALEFEAGDPDATAELAHAATDTPHIELLGSDAMATSLGEDGANVIVTGAGATVASPEGSANIGMKAAGDESNTQLVDGMLVVSDVAPATDLVTRALDGGVQMIAVLQDESAATDIHFDLELPESANLVEQPDGSIQVEDRVLVETLPDGELDRLEADLDAIVGPDFDWDNGEFTAEHQLLIDQLEPLEIVSHEEDRTIAVIDAPWAVDANGIELDTHYEIDGHSLIQKVEVTDDTAFPVTADPSLWWWTTKIAECIWNVGGFVFFWAKVAAVAVKVQKALKAGKVGTALNRAYKAWLRLGPDNATRMNNLALNLRMIAGVIQQFGYSAAKTKIANYGGMRKAAWDVVGNSAGVIATVTGLAPCFSLVTQRNY